MKGSFNMNPVFPYHSLPSFEEIELNPSSFLQPEKFMVDDELLDRDYHYMKELCPSSIRFLLEQIEDLCDRLEYEGSFLYDETPDKMTIYKLAEELTSSFSKTGPEESKDFILVILLYEFLSRRCRYYRKGKLFQ